MMSARRISVTAVSLLLLAATAMNCRAEVSSAEQLVKDTSDAVLARLKRDHDLLQRNPAQIYPLVEDIILPHFDFRRMSQWVLGRYWRNATEAQRLRFTEEFRILLVRTYAKALLEYTDQTINFLPSRAPEDAKTVTVRTEIVQSGGGPPIPLNYNLYRTGDTWKIYDIVVDGVSLVSNYRTSFATEIARSGLDGLIEQLSERNRQEGKGHE